MRNRVEIVKRVEKLFEGFTNLDALNEFLMKETGLKSFFESQENYKGFREFIKNFDWHKSRDADLGDFQTPQPFTDEICNFLMKKKCIPEVILEPTCGSGNFVISALKMFPDLKYIYCVEIQPEYEYLFKLNLLKLSFNQKINTIIEFHRDDIFTHKFSDSFLEALNSNVDNFLILGNPPWITNSELSVLNSANLPTKFNIKNVSGLEAITGSSNFDIAEFIIYNMIKQFSFRQGQIAMLCKTIVIKNLVKDMDKLGLSLSEIQSYILDSKKEFNISADSALLYATFGANQTDLCTVSSFYAPSKVIKKFGKIGKNLVSDIDQYNRYKYLDGNSLFEWRQGVKHDATKVMILKRSAENIFLNGFNELIDIEEDLLYPLVKGSDLRELVINSTSLNVIITQTHLNQDTIYIQNKFPKTWSYLNKYSDKLDGRKSQIYKNSNRFSIFGIGEYSFRPFKIAIAGLYKDPIFCLVFPVNGKPVMLDDTCYQLAFDKFEIAFITWILLNMDITKNFLSSIVFKDAKRPYTKKLLMRIDLSQLIKQTSYDLLKEFYEGALKPAYRYNLSEKDYLEYLNFYKNKA